MRNLIVFIFLCLRFSALTAADWPEWRGPSRNGISSETGWRVTSPPVIDWHINAGAGWSAVSSQNGRLYTMGNIENQDIVYCLNEKSGEEIWRYAYPCDAGNFPGPRSTPVLDGNRVYTNSRDGQFFCLDATSGKVIWQINIVDKFGSGIPRWGFAGSAVIEGELLLINACQYGIALDKSTGQLIWKSPDGIGGYATPVVYEQKQKKYIALFGETEIVSVDLNSGEKVWSYPWVTEYHINAADPIVIDNRIFISSGYSSGCAMLDISGKQPRVIWQNKSMSAQFSSAVFLKGYIYGSDGQTGRNGRIVCIKASDGQEVWAKPDRFNAMMSAAEKLIILNEQGQLIIAQASPESYHELFRETLIAASKSTPCWTAPVLTNGRIYLRNGGGELVAVRLQSE